MPGLFEHQRVEDLEQAVRQELGLAGDLEHAKAEKRVDALAIAEIGESGV